MSLSRFISPNTTLWQSILRVAKDPLIASNADSISVNPYSLYSSIDITNSKETIEPGTLVMCEYMDELIMGIVLDPAPSEQYSLRCVWEDGEIDTIDIRDVEIL